MKLHLKLLIFGSIIISLALGAMGYFVIEKTSENLHSQISKQLEGNITLGISKLQEAKIELTKITQVVAHNRYIKRALHLLESRGVSQIINDLIGIYPFLNYIIIAEPDGTIFSSSTVGHNGQKIAGEELLLENITSNKLFTPPSQDTVTISDHGQDNFLKLLQFSTSKDSQWYSAKVVKRGHIIGQVGLSIDWQTKYDTLLSNIKNQLYKTDKSIDQVLLIDQNNMIQASSATHIPTTKLNNKNYLFSPSPEQIWKSQAINFGNKTLNLTIIVNRDLLFAPIKETKNNVIVISVFSAIFLAAMLALILRLSVLKRIEELHHATVVIAGGNLNFRVKNLGHDEIGDLGKAYNKMAVSLQKITASKTDLDKEIKERVIATEHAKELATKAEQANKAKSEFLANMSHEIRTPMNGVIGMLGILSKEKLTDKQLGYTETAKTSAKYLLSIINDILDFSKIEAGKLEIENLPFNLHQLLNDFATELTYRTSDKGLDLHLSIEDNVPTSIQSDPGRLRQILLNLAGNAIKFTHQGHIDLHISAIHNEQEKSATINFSIQDTGVGIPNEQINLLFDSFSQVDSSTTRNYGGTGLGLAIVKQLSQLMGGDVNVSSKFGEGSCFSFSIVADLVALPFSTLDLSPPTAQYNDSNKCTSRTFNILLVEDNKVNQLVAQTLLESLGYTIHIAVNGQEALEHLETNHKHDLVLMDCQMPVMDGYKATQRIRASTEVLNSSIPIIAMTANAMKGDKEKCIQSGMDDYLSKPIDPNELAAMLKRWLNV